MYINLGDHNSRKLTFLMQTIAQTLVLKEEVEILLFDILGHFDIIKFSDVCLSHLEKKEPKYLNSCLKRLKIIQIKTADDLYKYLSCLEALIVMLPKSSLIFVDSVQYYYYTSFVYNKITQNNMTKDMFLNIFIQRFDTICKKYKRSLLFTLPEHMIKEESNKVLEDIDYEERKIYEHIRMKTDKCEKSYKCQANQEKKIIIEKRDEEENEKSTNFNQNDSLSSEFSESTDESENGYKSDSEMDLKTLEEKFNRNKFDANIIIQLSLVDQNKLMVQLKKGQKEYQCYCLIESKMSLVVFPISF